MEFKFEETSILQNMSIAVLQKRQYDLLPEDALASIDSYMYAFANFLSAKKNKDKPVAVCIVDEKNDIILAMVAEYQLNEEDEEKSNWYVWMTFDKEDINEKDTEVFKNTDGIIVASIANYASNRHNMTFKDTLAMTTIGLTFVEVLKKFLDVNASPEEEVSVVADAFTASVAVESDIKIMAITPGEDIKRTVAKTPRD